jgi:tRNA pseudouridine55 synthase
MDGILIIDKPQGMTSHDVVSFVRRLTGVRRVGHTGTLDPLATGVLPVCIGKATRVIEYICNDDSPDAKAYACEMQLGIMTDTQDVTGEVLETADFSGVTAEAVREALLHFEGRQTQMPPAYSAVKYKGRKLYEYARAGEPIPAEARRERPICIHRTEMESIDPGTGRVQFTVACSKGTYVRTLCEDVGKMLGCGATMAGLRRTKSGAFSIGDAAGVEMLKGVADRQEALPLLPMDEALPFLQEVHLSAEDAVRFSNGIAVPARDLVAPPRRMPHDQADQTNQAALPCRVYDDRGGFIGIGKRSTEWLKPGKVIVAE